ADLRAEVLIVGHHGSKTSTRKALLAAINPIIAVVSSGPYLYSGVGLPDAAVMTALKKNNRTVLTTKPTAAEAACKSNTAKIGPDKDGKPGGCDNIQITFTNDATPPVATVWKGHD